MKDLNELLPTLAICIVSFLICVAITRAIFSIPKFLQYQKAQTMTLLKIAEANGLENEAIQNIIDVIEPKGNNNVEGAEKRFRNIFNKL